VKTLGEGVWAIHVDVKTIIHLDKAVALDVAKVEATLKELKVKHSGIKRDDTLIL